MAELATERMVVAAPSEQCFAVVSDIERYTDWVGDIKEVSVHSRDGEGRPAEVAFRAGAFGRSTSYTLSTEVTYTLDVELRVPLPGFIKRRAQSRIMHTALEELKARVESSLTT